MKAPCPNTMDDEELAFQMEEIISCYKRGEINACAALNAMDDLIDPPTD